MLYPGTRSSSQAFELTRRFSSDVKRLVRRNTTAPPLTHVQIKDDGLFLFFPHSPRTVVVLFAIQSC